MKSENEQIELNKAVQNCLGDQGKLLGNVQPSPYDLFRVVGVVHLYCNNFMVWMEFSIK